jgi:uncharacterized protein (TIGR03118 family)
MQKAHNGIGAKLNTDKGGTMISNAVRAVALSLGIATIGLFSAPLYAQPSQHYIQTNLVSDVAGVAAVTDPNLVNPWGMSRSSTSPWWISDNGTGVSTLYSGTGRVVPLVVTIPAADSSSQTGTPTGQVFNGTTDFELAPGMPALFIFVTEDGTISGWNPKVSGTSAVIKVNTKGASVFKGVALATATTASGRTANFLYVADFRKGHVRVYDANFHHMRFGEDAFEDEAIPEGFAPFNVQNIGGILYVAFAKQDSAKHDEVDGDGLGFVDVFSPTGRLLRRLQHVQSLNAPWGLTQASSDFGSNSHKILVGQFGSGQILVFDPVTGRFKGPLLDSTNAPIVIDGLWDIGFGNDASSGPATTLLFTAGTGGEQHGLFGTITAIENLLGGDQ